MNVHYIAHVVYLAGQEKEGECKKRERASAPDGASPFPPTLTYISTVWT